MAVAGACVLVANAAAQEVSLEYQVKAAFLFNFTRFAEWPASALQGSKTLNICSAGTNPFGAVLDTTIAGERVAGRPIEARVVDATLAGCHILFVPRGVQAAMYLKQVGTSPVLTVGETPEFLQQGGVVNFVVIDGRVRFEIDQQAAERHQLKLSSRLLQLAVAQRREIG